MPAQITALPTPPSTNDPANFNMRADTFLAALPTFTTEANAIVTEIAASAQSASDFAASAVAKAAEATGQANQAAASAASALSAPGTNGTSGTSLTISAGAKTFTTQTGKAWVAGQGFFLASSVSPTNWMTGVLTSYNSGTGVATVQVDTIGGSGTFAAWNCGLAAGRSLPMASQAQAEAGTDNASWMSPLATSQAIAAQAFPIGSLIDKAGSLGASWLPCTGLNYLNSAYPALSVLMPAYVNPMTLRQAATGTHRGTYGGGVFIQWTNNGSAWQLYTSTDAVTWTLRTNPFGTGAAPYIVSYMNGAFVAMTNSATYTSADGVAWTVKALPSMNSVAGLTYAFGLFILVGYNTSNAGSIWTSPDLATWTGRTIPNSMFPNSIAYDAVLGKVLVVGSSSTWWISSNGTTWASATGQPSLNGNAVVSMGGKFFISGVGISSGGPMYAMTSDLTTWDTTVTSGASAVFGTVSAANWMIWDGAKLFAAQAQVLGCSNDGITWTVLNAGVSAAITNIMRAGPAVTMPTVIGAGAQGIRSGLDTSTTQFVAPTIAARASGFSCFIKAL